MPKEPEQVDQLRERTKKKKKNLDQYWLKRRKWIGREFLLTLSINSHTPTAKSLS